MSRRPFDDQFPACRPLVYSYILSSSSIVTQPIGSCLHKKCKNKFLNTVASTRIISPGCFDKYSTTTTSDINTVDRPRGYQINTALNGTDIRHSSIIWTVDKNGFLPGTGSWLAENAAVVKLEVSDGEGIAPRSIIRLASASRASGCC